MKELICIVCPRGCHLKVDEENGYKVTGNRCQRGVLYGYSELTNPTRVLTSTVVLRGGTLTRLPVRTDKAIPKAKLTEAMAIIRRLQVTAPIKRGAILLENIADSGANLLASRSIPEKPV